MKNALCTVAALLLSLPAIARTQTDHTSNPVPLTTDQTISGPYSSAADSALLFSEGFSLPRQTVLPSGDTAWLALSSARGLWISDDIDKNGKRELIVTDYSFSGRVHVFEPAGNNSIQWVWSSPRLDLTNVYGPGGNSTPRAVRTGDMDGDGKGEIIFPRNGYGVLLFEWDGVTGSHNFGTKPSAIAATGLNPTGGIDMRFEQFEVTDIDNDEQEELIIPSNPTGTANDDIFILHAVGNWQFEEPGFSMFTIVWSTGFGLAGLGGPTPYNVTPADLNGDGKREILAHTWNKGNCFVIKVNGPDSYTALPQSIALTNPDDKLSLYGGVAADLDNDGNEEVYYAWYNSGNPSSTGSVSVVNFSASDTSLILGPGKAAFISSGAPADLLTKPFIADLNGNGKLEVVTGTMYPASLIAYEYLGGPVDQASSYHPYVAYTGSIAGASAWEIRDSLGIKKDTLMKTAGEFMTKPFPPVDLDGDGTMELITTVQGMADPISVLYTHYTAGGAVLPDSGGFIANPSRPFLRSLKLNAVQVQVSHPVVFRAAMGRLIGQGFDLETDSIVVSGSYDDWTTGTVLLPGEDQIFTAAVPVTGNAGKPYTYTFRAYPAEKFSNGGLEYGPNRTFHLALSDQTLHVVDPFINVKGKITFPVPQIRAVHDVPDDNGKQVTVIWSVPVPPASNGVKNFGIWRLDQVWTFVGQTLVVDDTLYGMVVPTVWDSTKNRGQHFSTFRVSAHGTLSELFSVSEPDSGFSVDNRNPGTPAGVIAQYLSTAGSGSVSLRWSGTGDADLLHYRIYRDTVPGFTVSPASYKGAAEDTMFLDATVLGKRRYYYKIVSVDHSGNTGVPTPAVPVYTLSVNGTDAVPADYSLSQNFPNPFNPVTTISFGLPDESNVRLVVFDALGREVRTLAQGPHAAGYHSYQWDGGSTASGLYVYRITAVSRTGTVKYQQVRKMLLTK